MKRPRIGIRQWHATMNNSFHRTIRSFVIWHSNRRVIVDRIFPKSPTDTPYIQVRFGGKKWDLKIMRNLSR